MKDLFTIILLLFVFSVNVSAQKKTSQKAKQQTTLVTKAMSDKIANFCLYEQGYGKTVFYDSNSKYFSFSDIAKGKGTEVLTSLSKYPKYSENFIYAVYKTWGTSGWKQLGFTADEIARCKKISSKFIAERKRQEEQETAKKVTEETNKERELIEQINSGQYIEDVSRHAKFHINTESLPEKLLAWRTSESLTKVLTTWDNEILDFDATIGIKLDKTIDVLKIDGNITPQKMFLAEWLKSNVTIDSLATVKFPTTSKVIPAPSKGWVSISDDFECGIMKYSLPIKLKLKRNEQGILYLANESSILEDFLKEDKKNANTVVSFLKLLIASHPAFKIDKKQFNITLKEVYKENLIVQGERIPVGYVFNFENTKDFKWKEHEIVKYYYH